MTKKVGAPPVRAIPAPKKLSPTTAGKELARRVIDLLPPGFQELSQAEQAKAMGPWISQQSISILLAGKIARPRYLPELAQWLSQVNKRSITVEDLIAPPRISKKAVLQVFPKNGEQPIYTRAQPPPERPEIPVKYVCAAGSFAAQVANDAPPTEYVGRYLAIPDYIDADQYGVIVEGNSVNRAFPDGSVGICIPRDEIKGELRSGQYVHAVRINAGGEEEHTIKLLKLRPGRIELHPDSFESSHETYVFESGSNLQLDLDIRLEIRGVAIASVRQVPV